MTDRRLARLELELLLVTASRYRREQEPKHQELPEQYSKMPNLYRELRQVRHQELELALELGLEKLNRRR